MMAHLKLAVFTLLALLSNLVFAEKYTDSERTFMLKGKEAVLSDELMDKIRRMWEWPDSGAVLRVNSLFDAPDVRWVLDYIAIIEMINFEDCDRILFLETKKYTPESDDIKAFDGEIGSFDYIWIIGSCGGKHSYRVFNVKGEEDVTVVPASL